ncbi:MAG TPA: Asp-tRNA(Asn)/Glu-tRNA(Gln) amidotransferase subunit GatA [Gammaproteobacteria bacterium]|nr:Asp-tRNA(Asn)/Glu-tRNA(Gln) amidotransferase subunit GatA [Gammaproteobacteria bacterium]
MHEKTILDLQTLLDNKKISSVELTQHYLDRIEEFNPSINCYVHLNKEVSINMAKNADKLRSSGFKHPLLGIPLAHKDIFCTKDFPTTCCSKILQDYTSPYNATIINNLMKIGSVTLGKANMDEFAMGSTNETSIYGPCKNPWNLSYVPGGSSGGSCSAVSSQLCVASTGTDTGGSIRQPASFCGVTGLKPTYGRVSRFGMIAFASSLDQAGPIARSSMDCALLLESMAGKDPNDLTSIDVSVEPYSKNLNNTPLKGCTIGLPKEFFDSELDPGVRGSIEEAKNVFSSLGASFKEISIPSVKYSIATYYIIAPAEASSNLSRYDGVRFGYRCKNPSDLQEMYSKSRAQGFGEEVIRRILVGTFALSSGYCDQYYDKAQQVRGIIKNDFKQALKDIDVILTPTCPWSPFKIGERDLDPVKMYNNDVFTNVVNLAGLPAISFPSSLVNGLPNGVQLIGNYFKESTLLSMAHQFQQASDFHKLKPLLIQQ